VREVLQTLAKANASMLRSVDILFRNPVHESRVAQIVAEEMPGDPFSPRMKCCSRPGMTTAPVRGGQRYVAPRVPSIWKGWWLDEAAGLKTGSWSNAGQRRVMTRE